MLVFSHLRHIQITGFRPVIRGFAFSIFIIVWQAPRIQGLSLHAQSSTGAHTFAIKTGLEADRGQPLAVSRVGRGAQADREAGVLVDQGRVERLNLSLELAVQLLGLLQN